MKLRMVIAAAILAIFLAVPASAFTIDQGAFRLSVYDYGAFSLAVKDPVSDTYYRIASGGNLDIARLNASLKPAPPQKAVSGIAISGIKLVEEEVAWGAGAPCHSILTVLVQVTNNNTEAKTVYVSGNPLTVNANSDATITIQTWPCLGPIVVSSDPAGFHILDRDRYRRPLGQYVG